MVEISQQCDLAEDPLRVDEIVERSSDLLDGNFLPRLCVKRGYHYAVCAVPYRLD